MSPLFNSASFLYSNLFIVMLLIGSNAQAATTTAAGFNTTDGTNLSPSVAFGGSDETLTITAAAHVVGSTADGGGGTDILSLSNGDDLTALTSLVNFETLNLADGQNYTMSEVQHDAFTTINSTGTAQIILADSDGDDTVTGASSVEGYTLNDAYTFTLGDAAQNVTGNADNNQTVNIAGLTPTGILTGGTGGIDILRASHGANLSAATVSGFETLEVLTFGNLVTLTPAQFNSFTNVSPSSGGGSRSVAFSTSGTLSPSVNVSNTIGYRTVNGGAEVITLSAVQANGKTLVATDTANDNFIVTGSAGDQVLFGSLGNDNLDGGAGEDTLYSAGGADTLTGGSENDAFRGAASELNGDTITDLSVGDTIVITNTPAIGAVRFGASNNTLEVDTDGTDFSGIEVTINLSNTPGTRLVPNLVITTPNGFGQFDISFTASLPTISSATYNGGTGLLTVTGTNFVANSGSANDVDVSLLTITGNGGNSRAVTSATDVEITNATTFSVTLSGAEKDAVDLLLNKTGTSADDATTYNLAAAEDWMAGAPAATDIADLSGNGISVNTPTDTIKPRVISVSSSSGITNNILGNFIPVVITFSENVVITGIPQIELETGATDRLVDRVGPSSGISELKFDYQVQAGDVSSDLAYKAINSLTLNGGTIKDSAGNDAVLTLPAPGTAGSLSANKDHVVDGIVPTVVISGVPSNTNIAFTATFTFSEAVTGFDATDIALVNATKGTFAASSSTVYSLDITPTAAAVTVDVAANGALDASGNGNTAAAQATSAFDNTAPRISDIFRATPASSPTNVDSLIWTIAFNEIVKNLDVTDFEVSGTTATVQSISSIGESVFRVAVSGGDLADLNGTATLAIVSGHNITDETDNALINLVPTHQDVDNFVVDNIAPTLTLSAPSEASADTTPVTYTVTYGNADNITLALGDISLNKTGNANGNLILSGTGNTRIVTIRDFSGSGTLSISIVANTASDTAGNNALAVNSATINVETNQAGTIDISGQTIVGETLTATVADADGLTGVSIAYQWTSGGNSVGINSNSYTLQASDVGKTISVNAQYTDQGSTAENINSSATDAIITLQTDAVDRISSTANQAGGTPPTVDDYKDAGISGVSDAVLTRILPLINNAVARQSDVADVDDVSKLQTLINAILEGQDDDGDGLPNLVEGTVDTDKDGTTDRKDTDSDNDGVADQLEVRLTLTDSDSDGIIDVLDADVGNDGQVDTGKVDANFDGADDALDSMAELIAKAIADIQAAPSSNGEVDLPFKQFNQDQDQRPNHLDLDTDNDGIMDVVESGLSDTDGDGKLDTGDAVITDGSKLLDGDADSLPNMFEVKSDGISFDLSVNGLPDTLDTDANGILDSTIDMDRDGIIDSIDNAVGAQGTLPDVDKDGIPNHADTDDDGDGIPDADENSQQQYFTGQDADADGIDDGVDQNINGALEGEDVNENGVRDDRELSDMDMDGIADHLDADSDNDGIQDGQDIVVNVGADVKAEGTGTLNVLMMLSLLILSTLRYSRSTLHTSGVLLLCLGATISHAQSWQVNLGLGQSSLKPELANGLDTDEGGDSAVQLGLGYRIASDWLVELRYSDLGEADIRGSQGHSTLGYKSWALDTKYQLPLLQSTVWSPYVLGGISINRLQADDLSLEKKTDPGLMLGAGISYRFQEFQLNSELIRYSDDVAGWFMGVQKDF